MLRRIKKGLTVPITGAPQLKIEEAQASPSIGLLGNDSIGMKPTMLVKEGQSVKLGEPLYKCKKNEGLLFTSPAAGTVKKIARGDKRAFLSIEIEVTGDEHHSFSSFQSKDINSLSADEVRALLVESGQWVALRERPFDKTAPVSGDLPAGIFVSVFDTQPLSAPPSLIIQEHSEDFQNGLKVLATLSKVFLGTDSQWNGLVPDGVQVEQFEGPHPAGNVGTHMHFVLPPHANRRVWHVGYQDVIAIGVLFKTGKLFTDRYIALGGPKAKNPRILKTRFGANLSAVLANEESSDHVRKISGSILHGRRVEEPIHFLGRYHNQATILEEEDARKFLGWQTPGFYEFSAKPVYVSKLLPGKKFNLGTSTNGSHRALVPFGMYEQVCPLDTMATPLLKALLSKDTDAAQELGVLELAEEDMALFTFVCTGKTDYGPVLRENLELIEKEG